ncbi:hypothetical protein PHLCEN_2v4664 [Hermanssonia centrifuga]|uniref:Uncharacterized protein n=1 Tax=Hermanssonia centrifuga TaxID=98765 RepID=A0A2R6PMY0_9APHY|nr:hypothetical protein PHLCEN_2v4664 [Hermanssonia centrifuga]
MEKLFPAGLWPFPLSMAAKAARPAVDIDRIQMRAKQVMVKTRWIEMHGGELAKAVIMFM